MSDYIRDLRSDDPVRVAMRRHVCSFEDGSGVYTAYLADVRTMLRRVGRRQMIQRCRDYWPELRGAGQVCSLAELHRRSSFELAIMLLQL